MKRILKYALIALIVGVTLVTYINNQNIESSDITLYQEFSDTIEILKEKRVAKKELQKKRDAYNNAKELIIDAHPDLIEEGFEFSRMLWFNKGVGNYGLFVKRKKIHQKADAHSKDSYVIEAEYQIIVVDNSERKYLIQNSIESLGVKPYIYFYETDTKIFLKDLQPFPLVKSFDREILVKDNPEIQRYFLYDISLLEGRVNSSMYPSFEYDAVGNVSMTYSLRLPDTSPYLCEECVSPEVYYFRLILNEKAEVVDSKIIQSFFDTPMAIKDLPYYNFYVTEIPQYLTIGGMANQIKPEHIPRKGFFNRHHYQKKESSFNGGWLYDISSFLGEYIQYMKSQGYTQKY